MKMRRFIGAAAAMAVAGTLTVGAAAETYLIMLISVSRQHPTHSETLSMRHNTEEMQQTASTSTA